MNALRTRVETMRRRTDLGNVLLAPALFGIRREAAHRFLR